MAEGISVITEIGAVTAAPFAGGRRDPFIVSVARLFPDRDTAVASKRAGT